MQVDNQTLNVIKNTVQTSITPDYVGWMIGIIGIAVGITAIIITISIHRKQTRLAKQFEKIRRDAISDALNRIRQSLYECKHVVSVEMKLVDMVNGTDEEKISYARRLMNENRESRIIFADNIMKEADFVRGNINPELYNNIQWIVYQIKLFVGDEVLSANFGSPLETLNTWRGYGHTIIENADKIMFSILSLNR